MAQGLYITGTEAGSGKSVVALGVMETLAGRAQKAGFFRPIVGSGQPDPEIELMRGRYRLESSYEEMHALTVDEAHRLIASGSPRGAGTAGLRARAWHHGHPIEPARV